MTEENDELRPVGNMATLMEDVDSESGSQNGLQGVDIDDSAHEKEGTMVSLERPGTPREALSSGFVPQTNRFHNGNCQKCFFLVIQMCFLIIDVVFENAKLSTR